MAKRIVKIIIDALMFVIFVLLMEEHLIFDEFHEILGASVFVLFIAHVVLNYKWYAVLFKGKYGVMRIIRTVVNLLLSVMMILCFISSLMISGTVFAWLELGGAQIGRQLHMLSTAWVFVLMSLHLGLHWAMAVNAAVKRVKLPIVVGAVLKWALRVAVLGVSVFGVVVFVERAFYEELFLLSEFKWFDYSKSAVVYALETLCEAILFVSAAYYTNKLIRFINISKNKKEQMLIKEDEQNEKID